jgi:phosphoheptose isomerase
MISFFEKYKIDLLKLLESVSQESQHKCSEVFKKNSRNKKKIIFLGNGGSAATCSHIATDLTKNAKIKSINFNDASLITCLANDYGHDKWMKEALKNYSEKGDCVVIISASGESKNVINAAKWAQKNKIQIITFTGMKQSNTLKMINKNGINFWINSKGYNLIEAMHFIILCGIIDYIIGRVVYKSS